MNYLGHLYFSDNDIEFMYFNLLGDFVKGSKFENYTEREVQGIRLHRTIDRYIDDHEAVLELLHELYNDLPKIAGIAVDLYFDHLLAKNWDKYHRLSLNDFISNFYAFPFDTTKYNSPMFELVISRMKQFDWLGSYRHREGLERACSGLSKRISFENKLSEAPKIFDKFENRINETFEAFMTDSIPFFKNYHNQLKR